MKKITVILAAVILLVSCNNDFLNKTPLDKLSEDAVFNSTALAESYINALYTVLPDPFQEGNIGCITDEGYFRYGGSSTRYIASGNMTPDNVMYNYEGGQAHSTRTTFLNIWNRTYERIYRMNYFLNYVDEKGTNIPEDDVNRLKGEVYFLRAWAYYNLIQRYAGVPIITKAYDLTDTYDAKRDNFDDCVNFVLEDLDKAEELLPAKDKATKGRANKDIVLALRSRLTLVAASPLFNDPARPEGGTFRGQYSADKWKRALDATKRIIDRADVDGSYRLDDTYDGVWKNTDSPELIWAKYFISSADASDNTMKKAQLLYSVVYFNGWTAFQPTQAMTLDYEMTNGKKIFEDGSGYDVNHPFKGRDPRFYKSVASPFCNYPNTDNSGYHDNVLDLSLYYDNVKKSDFDEGKKEPSYSVKAKHLLDATSTMGLEMMKWYIPTSPITEAETGSVLYPWFRLAEMYLNYAECAYMTGNEALCRQYINKVRSRSDVRMPEIKESGEALWDRLVNERRVELAFEAIRYFDVRRWKTAQFYENVPFAGMRTMVLRNGSRNDTIYRVAHPYDESLTHTCYYWPNSDERKDYVKANTRDIFEEASKDSDGAVQVNGSCIKYRWLGKDYWVDYGDCRLTVSPTQKHFRKVNGEWPNYLMPIPANEMTKANGTLVQNPGY
ncbi:MAG: RagB/SusD family nutrient uptake outer membrane protein [Bacteroidales bacterium]|nr:RagB/SusD family nutrient uptake outer membrane protein [Bacteroidales bacterium]